MKKLPDVRRSIRANRAYTGKDISEAIRQIAAADCSAYIERGFLDLDGTKVFMVGIQSEFPYKNIVIATGDTLGNFGIQMDKSYDNLGVRSFDEIRGRDEDKVKYGDDEVILAVEEIRDRLEAILK